MSEELTEHEKRLDLLLRIAEPLEIIEIEEGAFREYLKQRKEVKKYG